jgi:hypothetical protein
MISFEDIKKANETIKTTDVKGKAYAEVNQRIKAFRMIYPMGTIKTELISNENGVCIFKAIVMNEDIILGTGTAYEKEGSSFINKTSYIENCETSAVGRALGMAGFGIDTSIASAEEVQNAIMQQNNDEKINQKQVDALYDLIKNKDVDKDEVLATLAEKGYNKLADIKIKDYMTIVKHFQNFIKR